MKLFLIMALISMSTALHAKENLICAVLNQTGKVLQRAALDLDSPRLFTSEFYRNDSRSLNLEKMNNDTVIVSVDGPNQMQKIELEIEKIQSIEKAHSFGVMTDFDHDRIICYDMKREDKAPFDLAF